MLAEGILVKEAISCLLVVTLLSSKC
jgi:hypothetical protein